MNVLLINPPYQTLTSNFGVGHQVPLGLLTVGGPLIDAGHRVRLLDAERRHLGHREIVRAMREFGADVVMTGHAGSTPAHPTCVRMLRAIKAECPRVLTIYGGVYPTYHAAAILETEPAVDVVVCGEGEAAPVEVLKRVGAVGASDGLRGGRNRFFPLSPEYGGEGRGEGPKAERTKDEDRRMRASKAFDLSAFILHPSTGTHTEDAPHSGPLPRVRGRGDDSHPLSAVPGIAFRAGGRIILTPDRSPLRDLDGYRVGWELIENWDDYTCFGLGRAAIVQFSRGCPHRCTYCGQHGFWVSWRHRDPLKLADEMEWLHRTHGIHFITLADENPTTRKDVWRRLLEELAGRRLPVSFFATIRASDIVRDADLLPLYRRAGILYVLMGIESTSDEVLRQVRKGSTIRHDFQACRLLKQHGIFSILGHISGLGGETWASFRTARRQLACYDGDYLNAMYVTPHDWTVYGKQVNGRAVVEPDLGRWDYRHQVLAQERMRPWQLFAAVKWLELCFHLRPGRVWAVLRERDPLRRRQLAWCSLHTGMVWAAEVAEFVTRGVAGMVRRRLSGLVTYPRRVGSILRPSYGRTSRPLRAHQ